jgi:hypothetical protein
MKKTTIKKRVKGIEKRQINKGWNDPTCTPMDITKGL